MGVEGFAPTYPKERIYSPPRLSNFAALPNGPVYRIWTDVLLAWKAGMLDLYTNTGIIQISKNKNPGKFLSQGS